MVLALSGIYGPLGAGFRNHCPLVSSGCIKNLIFLWPPNCLVRYRCMSCVTVSSVSSHGDELPRASLACIHKPHSAFHGVGDSKCGRVTQNCRAPGFHITSHFSKLLFWSWWNRMQAADEDTQTCLPPHSINTCHLEIKSQWGSLPGENGSGCGRR